MSRFRTRELEEQSGFWKGHLYMGNQCIRD